MAARHELLRTLPSERLYKPAARCSGIALRRPHAASVLGAIVLTESRAVTYFISLESTTRQCSTSMSSNAPARRTPLAVSASSSVSAGCTRAKRCAHARWQRSAAGSELSSLPERAVRSMARASHLLHGSSPKEPSTFWQHASKARNYHIIKRLRINLSTRIAFGPSPAPPRLTLVRLSVSGPNNVLRSESLIEGLTRK